MGSQGAGHGIYTETTVSTQLCAVGARRIYRAYVPEAPKILDREGVGLHGLGRRRKSRDLSKQEEEEEEEEDGRFESAKRPYLCSHFGSRGSPGQASSSSHRSHRVEQNTAVHLPG